MIHTPPYCTPISVDFCYVYSIAKLKTVRPIGWAISLLTYPTIATWWLISWFQNIVELIALSVPLLLKTCLLNHNWIWRIVLLYSDCDAVRQLYILMANPRCTGSGGPLVYTGVHICSQYWKLEWHIINHLWYADTLWKCQSCNRAAFAQTSVDVRYQTRW